MTNWRTYGDIGVVNFVRELQAVNSPMLAEWDTIHGAAGDLSGLMAAMAWHESRYATAFNANVPENRNPLNLRPRGGGAGFMKFATFTECVRVWRSRLVDSGYAYAHTTTLQDLIHVYAPSSDGNNEAAYVSAIERKLAQWKGTQPVAEIRIILNPGHRNTSGGNPDEAAFTPQLASAYFDAFSAAGYETVNLGDTSGGLDETCRRMASQIASAPGECVLLDLHLEGGGPPGAFAIIPDVAGLRTNAPVPQDPADTWENNSRDRTLGNEIVTGIVNATGLTKRQARLPGLMDESQTGVGGQGYRLATFAYTSPYRAKAVRLVVEHGCHTTEPDRSIIFAPGFAQKCALAAVYAVRAVYGSPGPVQPPGPVYAEPEVPAWFAASVLQKHPSDATVDGVRWFALRRNFEALKNTNRYSQPDTSSPKSGPKITTREKIVCERYFRDPVTKRSWIVEPDGSYVTAASLTPAVTIKSR